MLLENDVDVIERMRAPIDQGISICFTVASDKRLTKRAFGNRGEHNPFGNQEITENLSDIDKGNFTLGHWDDGCNGEVFIGGGEISMDDVMASRATFHFDGLIASGEERDWIEGKSGH